MFAPLLVDLRNAAQNDGNVAMIARELGPGDAQKFSVQFKGTIELAALMEGLPSVEGRGGVVQTIEAERSPANFQCLFVVFQGLIELIALDVDAAHVIQRRGYLGMVPAVSGITNGKRSAEVAHGLGRMVGREVVMQDAQAVEGGPNTDVIRSMDCLGMMEGGFVRFDGIVDLSQAVLQLANVLKDGKGEDGKLLIAGLGEIFIFLLVLVIIILPMNPVLSIEDDIADKSLPRSAIEVGGLIKILCLAVALTQIEEESGRDDVASLISA